MVLGWSPFKFVWDSPVLYSIRHCYLKQKYLVKMSSNVNCSYIAMRFTYFPGFSVKFFFKPIYTDYVNQAYFDTKIRFKSSLKLQSNLNQIWLGWSFGYLLSKLCPTFYSRWQMLLKIESSLKVLYCFIISQNEIKF